MRGRNRKRADPLSIDLRGLTAAADPLFQPFAQLRILQLQPAAQRALPDHQYPPALGDKRGGIAPIAQHVLADFIQPEVSPRGRDFKQITVVVMPETTVGKNDARVISDNEIRTPGKRRVLHAKIEASLGQQAGQPFFYSGITRADGPHVFTAGGLIVNIRH
ncbi:hypothetical protein ENTCAN_06758 [Enterobacter cancerogenus ATCC 35316]|nr:hypothetical protein ENTCAN_06758 [Enterobacter cancerogenus ATCC 35316]